MNNKARNTLVRKFRNAADARTHIRVHGTRAFSDFLLYAVIKRRDNIKTSNTFINIVRAFYVVNTKDDNRKEKKSNVSK